MLSPDKSKGAGQTGAPAATQGKADMPPLTLVKYEVNPLDKASANEEAFSGDMVMVLAVQAFVTLLIFYAIYSLHQAKKGIFELKEKLLSRLEQMKPSVASPAGDLSTLTQSVAQLKSKVETLISSVSSAQSGVATALAGLPGNLSSKLSVSVAAAINESPIGTFADRCNALEQKLKDAESQIARLTSEAGSHEAAVFQLNDQLKAMRVEGERLKQDASSLVSERDSLNKNLAEERSKLDLANAETAKEREASAALRKEAQLCFAHLLPAKLMGGELEAQIRDAYQLAMAGEAPSVALWSTLTSFGSAQSDPGAKDFQLQIVRRLGIVLVQSWRHKGLNDKERHEQLSVWAKCLNEHADGRYNLFVPGLGTPIDRARMACATSATTVREVLCWQVRNAVGANFSLAEVA
jgi:predicted  nucleic acid-binding Zn-ribbon protein